MRLFPVVLTILIAALIGMLILQRDALFEALGVAPEPEVVVAATEEDSGVTTSGLIRVLALRSEAQVIDTAVVLRGQTEAARSVEVRAETSATVISEPIRKGNFVEVGQELCRLDPGTRGAMLAEARARLSEAMSRKTEAASRVPETEARVTEAEARLVEALSNENVAVKLSEDGFASDTRVKNVQAGVAAARAAVEASRSGLTTAQAGIQSAQAGIESAEAGVAAAEKEIERLTIRAPFSGVLENDTAELGALLQPGALCATVLQLDPIKLVAFVPETEVARVQVGALAGAELTDGNRISGQVMFLSRAADPTTRTFRVEIEVPNPNLELRDGQTAEILIAAQGEVAHLLPSSALTLNDEGVLGVRTVGAENVVEFAPVTLLRDTPDGVWLGGLPELVDVIVVGQEYVTEGVTVDVTYREAKT